jgi:hypothetical protein
MESDEWTTQGAKLRYVRRAPATACEVWLEVGRGCEAFHDVVDCLAGERAAFLGHKEGVVAVLVATIVEIGPESLLGAEGAAAVEGKCLGFRGGVAGVAFLDLAGGSEMAVFEVEHIYGELGGFAAA